jgi:hypothetical protein
LPSDRDPALGFPDLRGYKPMNAGADRYFDQIFMADELRKDGRPVEALASAIQTLELLPNLIEEWVREYGRFDIKCIPPIETGCILAALLDDEHALQAISGVVDQYMELEPWRRVVAAGWEDLQVVRAIRGWLGSRPGTVQSDLGKDLGRDGRSVARLVHYMSQAGQLRREKEGRSYRLYLVSRS